VRCILSLCLADVVFSRVDKEMQGTLLLHVLPPRREGLHLLGIFVHDLWPEEEGRPMVLRGLSSY
jgi:hypothetical protein